MGGKGPQRHRHGPEQGRHSQGKTGKHGTLLLSHQVVGLPRQGGMKKAARSGFG
jgi:hypothetical protein